MNKVNELIAKYINEEKIPGAITLIARGNKVVHFECAGSMNIEENLPMQEDTIFRFYSMTKPVTSVAMMMLHEKGHFKLDTPVSEFIPAFKKLEVFKSGTIEDYTTVKPEREMTIADLLSHTSGLTYDFMNTSPVDAMYRAAGIQGSHADGTLQELVNKLADLPLVFSPGTRWNYSLSTEVVAYLVQLISDMRFDEFIKKNIAEPLEMIDTDFYVPADKQKRFAANYTHIDLIPEDRKKQFSQYMSTGAEINKQRKLMLIDSPKTGRFSSPRTFYSGGGGLVSTASDYFNFSQMLLNKGVFKNRRLLNPETIALMTRNHLPADLAQFANPGFSETSLAGIGFGLGFAVMLDPEKANLPGNPGEYNWGGGANTWFFIDPQEELIAILLTQLLPSTAYKLRQEFKAAVYGAITL